MEVSRSSYSSERRYEETRYDNVPVYQAQSSSTSAYHVDKNVESSSKHRVQRHLSEASSAGYSDSSAASKASGYLRKGKKDKSIKKVKSESKKKAKSDSLKNRWHKMVGEYEDTYVEGRKRQKSKTAIRSNQKKIKDSSQYDNVRQVFSKSMPITMQTAPPGARARDLETDSMASDRSERSWKLGRRKQAAVDHSQLRMSKSTPNLAAEESTQKHASRVTQVSRSNGTKTRSQSAGRHVSYLTDSAPDVSISQAKKRYKSRKKEWGLQTEAARIVDGVINNALDFLYGSSGKSHRSRHVSRTSDVRTASSAVSHGLSSEKQARVASFSNIRAAERSQHHKEHKVMVSGSMPNLITSKTHIGAADQRASQKSSNNVETRRQNQKILRRSADVSMRLGYDRNYEIGIGALGSSGYQSPSSTANRSSPKYKESFSSTYSTGQWSSVSSPRSVGARQYNSARSNPADVQPSWPTIYSSDSEYSTTVEIRGKYNSDREQTTAQPATRTELSLSEPETLYRSPRKQADERRGNVNPPTLTKGNITKVFCGREEMRTSGLQQEDASSPVVSAVRSLDDQMSPPVERLAPNTAVFSDSRYDGGISGTPTMHTRFTHVHAGEHLTEAENSAGLLSVGPVCTTTISSSVQNPAYDSVPLHLDLNRLSPRQQKPSYSVQSGQAPDVLNSPEGRALPTIDEVDESRYAAFSNEPMIVGDLLSGESERIPSSERKEYTIKDNLYGTENAIRMNTKQNLNLYIFNRRKDDVTAPALEVSDSDPDDPDVVDYDVGRETELQRYQILHKQTQTPAIELTSPPARSKKKSRSVVVHRVESPPKVVYRDTTHYITKEREIEKLPPQKAASADMCVQTEDPEGRDEEDLVSERSSEVHYGWEQHTEVPLSRLAKPDRHISEVYVTHTIPKPIISESRQMESLVEYRTPPSPAPEPTGKQIPVVREKSENFFEKMDTEWKKQQDKGSQRPAPAPDSGDESEEEILETTVVEEKEQRIAMAIYEEVEFSAQRKEGGNAVDVDNPVPAFWLPNRYEGVMERKRQKKTQITNIEKEGNRLLSGSGPNVPALEGTPSAAQPPADFKPKVTSDMTVESSRRTYRSDQSTNQNRDPTPLSQRPTPRADQQMTEERTRRSQEKSSQNSKTKDIPVRTTRETSEALPEQTTKLSTSGSLPRQRISLPVVSRRSRPFSPSDDKLPEDLAHFDKVVQELERELPKRPQTKPKPSARQIMIHKAKDHGKVKRTPDAKVDENEAAGRRVSKSDPENVSFKSTGGADLLAKVEDTEREITMSEDQTDKSILGFDLPLRAIDGCVVHSEQSEPKIETKYIKDADGNTLKVTELSHTLSKCLEYEDHPTPAAPTTSAAAAAAVEEQMHEGSYIDMNLLETISSDVDNDQESETSEEGSFVSVVAAKPKHDDIPEVTAQTTTGLRPVQFDVQQSTLKLNDEGSFPEHRHLIFDSRSRSDEHNDENYPYETMTTAL